MSAPKTLRNVFTVGAFTMLSRVLGLVREMLQSRLIGAGMEQAAFTLAFAIPNMARKLFGEGALTAAFVPVFKGLAERDRMDAARRLARAVATMAWLMLGAAVLLAMLGVGGTLALWPAMPGRAAVTLRLLLVMLPYALFICAAAFGMGVLNALGRFAAAAFAPCLLNLVWIGTLLAILLFPDLSIAARVRILAWAVRRRARGGATTTRASSGETPPRRSSGPARSRSTRSWTRSSRCPRPNGPRARSPTPTG